MAKTAVVILGNRLESHEIHPELRARVETGVELYRGQDSDRLVCSGGAANPEVDATEAEVMADYAASLGVDRAAITLEDESLDTVGNGFYTRLLLDDLTPGGTVRVVTSCYHADRAAFVFEQCFGDEYTVRADECAPVGEGPQESSKRAVAEALFEPVAPGALSEIRERILSTHTLYDSLPAVES